MYWHTSILTVLYNQILSHKQVVFNKKAHGNICVHTNCFSNKLQGQRTVNSMIADHRCRSGQFSALPPPLQHTLCTGLKAWRLLAPLPVVLVHLYLGHSLCQDSNTRYNCETFCLDRMLPTHDFQALAGVVANNTQSFVPSVSPLDVCVTRALSFEVKRSEIKSVLTILVFLAG